MYEHFRNELIQELSKSISAEVIKRVLPCIDRTMENYDVTSKVTDLVVYEYHEPETLRMYIACKNVEGYSKQTLKNYYYALRLFFDTLRKPLSTITTNDVRAYIDWYKNSRNIQSSALDKLRQTLNSFFNETV